LRQSILTLAVRGKLVPQAQHDEAAIAIIQASRDYFQQLIAKKRISVPKALPPIKDEEIPFSLPSGWVWCRFGDLVRISSGDGLTTKQMIAGPIPVYGGNGITGYHNAYNVSQKTLVIGRVGFYCGSIHVTQTKAWVTDNAFVARFDEKNVSIEFLYWLLTATDLRKRDNSTAQPVISGAKIYPVILGIPPLAEQKRIVAKVDTLMAMVEKLETQISSRRDSAEKLLEAVVHELTNHN
jgi:type I restriction enzyme S subunit